jgi:hypothetical protein
MNVFTETGMLPLGVEFEGQIHREYEIKEQLVSDTVAVYEHPEYGPKAARSNTFFNIAVTALRIVRLGTIPKESITPDLVMGMFQKDCNELANADDRLEARRISFRDENEGRKGKGDPAQEAGVQQ